MKSKIWNCLDWGWCSCWVKCFLINLAFTFLLLDRCSVCRVCLSDWYFERDGRLYCRDDYWTRFGEACNKCGHIISGPVMVSTHKYLYRPQTKFAKVMFSQVFVCPQGGVSVSVRGCLHPGGLCPGGGLCPWGSLSRGVSVQEGLCLVGSLSRVGGVSVRETPLNRNLLRTVTSGRYASYWNAFLFTLFTPWHSFYVQMTCTMVIRSVFSGFPCPIRLDKVSVAVRFYPMRLSLTWYILSHENYLISTQTKTKQCWHWREILLPVNEVAGRKYFQ